MKKKVKRNIRQNKSDNLVYGVIVGIFVLIAIFLFVIFNNQEDPNYIVATVNGEDITQADLMQLKGILEQQTGQEVPEDVLIDQAITRELLIQELALRNLTVTLEDAEAALTELLFLQNSTLEDLKLNIVDQGADYEQIIAYYQIQLGIFALVDEASSDVIVTQEEVLTFYETTIAVDTENSEVPPFEDIEADITVYLLDIKQREVFNEFINFLRESATIIIS
jgi:hypothetical protein